MSDRNEKITLYFTQGKSDKVYNASIEEAGDDLYVVNFSYGRRGTTLATGTKTQSPVAYDKAKKAFDKLITSKTAKGYRPGEDAGDYVHLESDAADTGIFPQLLNEIEKHQVAFYIANDDWSAQQKYDGKRMLLKKEGDQVTAINRTGKSVGAPKAIIDSAQAIDHDFLLDGEAVGEVFWAFDLLEYQGEDTRHLRYSMRYALMRQIVPTRSIRLVETAKTTAEKQKMFLSLDAEGQEGIVFKRSDAPFSVGRPNTGGDQLKYKFWATASVYVSRINDKRSVGMVLYDGQRAVDVGNVTIPSNKEIPVEGMIVDVRYLYAYEGGSLFEPTYIGPRDDVGFEALDIKQLKFKSKEEA